MRRLALAIITLMFASACTPAEIAVWEAVHDAPPSAQLTEHDILWIAINETFPASQHATARRVATCESGDNESFTTIDMRASSPTNDHGPFQINATVWNKPWHSDPVAQYIGSNWQNVYDPIVNTEMAYRIWEKYGWGMWSCY